LRALVAASVLLPALQLVPLPPAIWTALPGRDLIKDSFGVASLSEGWMPVSVFPLRTALALSAMITPVAIIMAGWALGRRDLLNLGWLVVGLGVVTVLMGAIQASGASAFPGFWPEGTAMQILRGTFANRNSAGLLLVGSLALVICLPAPRSHPTLPAIRLALCTMLLTGVILTQSRTALALSLIPLMLALARITVAMGSHAATRTPSRRWLIALGVFGMGFAAVTIPLVTGPGRTIDTLNRFAAVRHDPRQYIWEDAAGSASRYWPVGAGMGTFDEVFPVDETLENLGARPAGRAHNDFVEVAIEAGLAGVLLIIAWVLLLTWLAWRARRSPDRWTAWAASAFLVAIALQSITDYPLRSQTMLAIAALCLLLLARIAADRPVAAS
jgi:O-antigen ligase